MKTIRVDLGPYDDVIKVDWDKDIRINDIVRILIKGKISTVQITEWDPNTANCACCALSPYGCMHSRIKDYIPICSRICYTKICLKEIGNLVEDI